MFVTNTLTQSALAVYVVVIVAPGNVGPRKAEFILNLHKNDSNTKT